MSAFFQFRLLVLAPGQQANRIRLKFQLTEERQTRFTLIVFQVCKEFVDAPASEFLARLQNGRASQDGQDFRG